MPQALLQKKILKSVSRSFYLSLRVLPERMRPALGLGYLLCRTADSIADTDVLPQNERLKVLQELKILMGIFPIPNEQLHEFSRHLAFADTKSAEGKLLSHFKDCIEHFHGLSRTDQALVQQVVQSVIKGMEMDLTTFGETSDTLRAFSTKDQLQTYIHEIAGEPGRFWTGVCLKHIPGLQINNRDQWLRDGIRFGTGLQMINILRDLSKDLQRGRCYIPTEWLEEYDLTPLDLLKKENTNTFLPLYHRLIDQTLDLMKNGLAYLIQIPRCYLRLRAAVWWPMAIGMKTLANLRISEHVLDSTKTSKMSRREVYWLVSSSWLVLPSNKLLARQFKALYGDAHSSSITNGHRPDGHHPNLY